MRSGGTGFERDLVPRSPRARLTEEDVAARLQVDPKTVRRWLEGRVPYLRHRWAIATMLALDETDLWPQLRRFQDQARRGRCRLPSQREHLPRTYGRTSSDPLSAKSASLQTAERSLRRTSASWAHCVTAPRHGVIVRICLRTPRLTRGSATLPVGIRDALAPGRPVPRGRRTLRSACTTSTLSNSIYRADDELIIGQHAFGVPASAAPVLSPARRREHRTGSHIPREFRTGMG